MATASEEGAPERLRELADAVRAIVRPDLCTLDDGTAGGGALEVTDAATGLWLIHAGDGRSRRRSSGGTSSGC